MKTVKGKKILKVYRLITLKNQASRIDSSIEKLQAGKKKRLVEFTKLLNSLTAEERLLYKDKFRKHKINV